jgi:hypothetical protein
MAAVARQFHGAAGIAAVLAAIFTIFRGLTIACRVSAFLSLRHMFPLLSNDDPTHGFVSKHT